MSKYLSAITRLQAKRQERLSAPEVGSDLAGPRDLGAHSSDSLFEVQPFSDLPLAKRRAAFSQLLDQLRAIADKTTTSSLVISSVSGFEPMDAVLAGVARECQARALRLLVGEVAQDRGKRFLIHRPDLSAHLPQTQALPVTLSGRTATESVEEWLRSRDGQYELALLKAPPIVESADGTLLAKASGGLVLIVQPLTTTRHAVRTAMYRARSAECPVVGLVIVGSRNYLPRWLHRLLSGALQSSYFGT